MASAAVSESPCTGDAVYSSGQACQVCTKPKGSPRECAIVSPDLKAVDSKFVVVLIHPECIPAYLALQVEGSKWEVMRYKDGSYTTETVIAKKTAKPAVDPVDKNIWNTPFTTGDVFIKSMEKSDDAVRLPEPNGDGYIYVLRGESGFTDEFNRCVQSKQMVVLCNEHKFISLPVLVFTTKCTYAAGEVDFEFDSYWTLRHTANPRILSVTKQIFAKGKGKGTRVLLGAGRP